MSTDSFNKASGKLWIFAGEASGDAYGAMLAKALWQKDDSLEIAGMGAKAMRDAGVDILVDSTELGVVGIVEVLKHYPMFKRIFNELVEKAASERPDAIILIDYPGFNLRFAAKMKELDIKVIYYISPQVWAWNKKRIPKIAKLVSHMMVIFPFEKDIYKEHQLPTTFIGHPLLELLDDGKTVEREDDLIAILPGSRFSEINRLLIPLIETIKGIHQKHPNYRFVIPAPRESIASKIREECDQRLPKDINLSVAIGETSEWMRRASAGIAASGTVTVQAAILGLPLVVVYKINPITYFIFKLLVKIKFITMVNLVADKLVYEEFMQGDVKPATLIPALERILKDGSRRIEVESGIKLAIDRLGGTQKASAMAADIVIKEIS